VIQPFHFPLSTFRLPETRVTTHQKPARIQVADRVFLMVVLLEVLS